MGYEFEDREELQADLDALNTDNIEFWYAIGEVGGTDPIVRDDEEIQSKATNVEDFDVEMKTQRAWGGWIEVDGKNYAHVECDGCNNTTYTQADGTGEWFHDAKT